MFNGLNDLYRVTYRGKIVNRNNGVFFAVERMKTAFRKLAGYIRLYRLHILATFMILLTIVIVYWRDFEILANEALRNEATSHIVLVPFLVGFLMYQKKDLVKAAFVLEKTRKKTKYLDEVIGVALCFVAFLLYWYGSYTFYPLEYHLFSLPIFTAGITVILFSLKTFLVLAFPVLFLLFLIPIPTQITYTIGGAMANFNTQASYKLLSTLGLPVTLQSSYGPPTIAVAAPSGQPIHFAIDVPCSGIYSLTAFTMFATFLAYIMLAPLFKKAAIFAFGFLVFGIANILRITIIVSIGYWLGEEIAMLLFHTVTGWLLILIGMLFILFVIERLWNVQILQSSQKPQTCSMCNTGSQDFATFCSNCGRLLSAARSKFSSKFWAKLILILLGAYVVTLSIQAPTFAVAKGVIKVSSNSSWENATNIFPEIPNYQLKFLYRDVNYEKIAGQDVSLLYAYLPTNMSNPTVYVDLGVAKAVSNLHNWEVCLITWQTSQGRYPLVSVLDSRDSQLLEDVPIIARYLVFETPANQTQVTLYWYEKATFKTGLTVEQKYVRISLIILTLDSTMYTQFENELLAFGQSIAAYWKPLKSQSLISMGIPMQQAILGLAIAFVTVTETAEHMNKWRKKSNNLRIFNNFASLNEKLVLQTIQQLTMEKKVVQTKLVISALANAENPMKYNDLIDILNRLEKYGLIKKDIANISGKPLLVWKS